MPKRDAHDAPRREEELWDEFGAQLRRLRLARGWSTRELSARTKASGDQGVSDAQIRKLEHGGYRDYAGQALTLPNPKDEKLVALARALGVDPQTWFALIGRYDERERTRGHAKTGGPAHREALADRIRDLEAEVGRMRARQAETDALLREHGIGEPGTHARRRSRVQPQTAD
jgi:transcriptional regulator with XRE-family HTH domain